DRPIGVDPQRIRPHLELLRGRPGALNDRSWPYARQRCDQPRVLWVEVLEDDALVVAERIDPLIPRRRLKEGAIDVLGQRALGPGVVGPQVPIAAESVAPLRPR